MGVNKLLRICDTCDLPKKMRHGCTKCDDCLLPNRKQRLKDAFGKIEIRRLENLLKLRQEEYQIFGATPEDREKDIEILAKINSLETATVKT